MYRVINKNTFTAIKSWPACCANPNKSFAVLKLRASQYLSDRKEVTGRLCFPDKRAVAMSQAGDV